MMIANNGGAVYKFLSTLAGALRVLVPGSNEMPLLMLMWLSERLSAHHLVA